MRPRDQNSRKIYSKVAQITLSFILSYKDSSTNKGTIKRQKEPAQIGLNHPTKKP